MYRMLTKIVVKPGKRSELLEYLRWDIEVAKESEPGTWRFDVWEAEPGVVYLYEAYKDRGAFEDHAKGDPYEKWGEVADETIEHREPGIQRRRVTCRGWCEAAAEGLRQCCGAALAGQSRGVAPAPDEGSEAGMSGRE